MDNYLKRLEPRSLKMVRDIGRLAHGSGLRTFIAGGCVRDLVLGHAVKDVDIAVVGDAVALARQFASAFCGTIVVYKQFGTATVTLNDGAVVDFATLRKESYPYPGALPVVSPGTIEEDLFRRDFTINAMAIAIDPAGFGRLIDHYGGFNDLKRKVIRVLHDKSFVDDPTRILRAVRFEQRFGFKIEPVTLRLLRLALRKDVIKAVKPQRFFEEFKKNLSEIAAVHNLKRLNILGCLKWIDAHVVLNARQAREIRKASDSLVWAQKNLADFSRENAWLVYWMILCDGLSLREIRQKMDRFAFRSSDRDKVIGAFSTGDVLEKLVKGVLSDGEAFSLLRSKSPEELLYLETKCSKKLVLSRIRKHLRKWQHIVLKINGDDLKRLGIPSGKIFKEILDEVLCRVVDGRLRLKSQQLAYANDLYQRNQK